jgi:hypothetical protein
MFREDMHMHLYMLYLRAAFDPRRLPSSVFRMDAEIGGLDRYLREGRSRETEEVPGNARATDHDGPTRGTRFR